MAMAKATGTLMANSARRTTTGSRFKRACLQA